MVAEIARVLKPGGVFLLITNGSPEKRMELLQDSPLPWKSIQHYEVSKPQDNHIPNTKREEPPEQLEGAEQSEQLEGASLSSSSSSSSSSEDSSTEVLVRHVYVCTL